MLSADSLAPSSVQTVLHPAAFSLPYDFFPGRCQSARRPPPTASQHMAPFSPGSSKRSPWSAPVDVSPSVASAAAVATGAVVACSACDRLVSPQLH